MMITGVLLPWLANNESMRRDITATYECSKCGMAVNITCAKCNAELVDGEVVLDDGTIIPTAECPNGDGKIIKPKCCGEDMSCEISG